MEQKDAQQQLLMAIAFIDHPGVNGDYAEQLRRAIELGADPNDVSEDGETALTAAILGGMGSPSAVEILLANGADPNRRDGNGWTPWGACYSRREDRVVAEPMKQIQAQLAATGATTEDEAILGLEASILAGDVEMVQQAIEGGIDPSDPMISAVNCAISSQNMTMLKLLLDHGLSVNHTVGRSSRAPLMVAASLGYQDMAEVLLQRGADINACFESSELTAEMAARSNGHEALADWLSEQPGAHPKTIVEVPEKFKELARHNTEAINFDLNTADIVEHLQAWDQAYGISISDVAHDGLLVNFDKLPEALNPLAADIYQFCPDVIDQGLGAIDDAIAMLEEAGQEVPSEMAKLVEGIDFDDEDFGIELLARDLANTKQVRLWWD